jgi:hypothetical protein
MPDDSVRRQARLRPEYAALYGGLSLDRWYDVIDREPKAAWTRAPGGYLWISANGRRLVQALHFEIRERNVPPTPVITPGPR